MRRRLLGCGHSERQGAHSQVRPRAELQEKSKVVGDVGAGTGWAGEGRRALTGSDSVQCVERLSVENKKRGLLGQCDWILLQVGMPANNLIINLKLMTLLQWPGFSGHALLPGQGLESADTCVCQG